MQAGGLWQSADTNSDAGSSMAQPPLPPKAPKQPLSGACLTGAPGRNDDSRDDGRGMLQMRILDRPHSQERCTDDELTQITPGQPKRGAASPVKLVDLSDLSVRKRLQPVAHSRGLAQPMVYPAGARVYLAMEEVPGAPVVRPARTHSPGGHPARPDVCAATSSALEGCLQPRSRGRGQGGARARAHAHAHERSQHRRQMIGEVSAAPATDAATATAFEDVPLHQGKAMRPESPGESSRASVAPALASMQRADSLDDGRGGRRSRHEERVRRRAHLDRQLRPPGLNSSVELHEAPDGTQCAASSAPEGDMRHTEGQQTRHHRHHRHAYGDKSHPSRQMRPNGPANERHDTERPHQHHHHHRHGDKSRPSRQMRPDGPANRVERQNARSLEDRVGTQLEA